MSWALFCQIEVILLTAGLIYAFCVSVKQNAKDNSFFKRVAATGSALSALGKSMEEKKKDEQTRMLQDFFNNMKQNKKDEKKNDE